MTKVKLGDVAIERKQTYKGNKDNIPSVGLEHLTPSEVKLSRWDINVDNTFTKEFTKGQILLGRRRAYLKKAVIAPFDGICSGDITTIEAIPNEIREDLLPFIIQNDRFFDYAIKGSAGSLSPRVKWEYLKEYEFDLPPIEEQEHLAKLLWAAYELKESYKKLIVAIDEMVKAQFIEMFGDPDNNKLNYQIVRLGDVLSLLRNGANIKQIDGESGLPITRIETIADRTFNRKKMGYAGIKDIHKYSEYILQHNDILMSHINSVGHIGKSAIYERMEGENIIHGMNLLCLRPIPEKADSTYLYFYFQMPFFRRNIEKITKKAINQASFTTTHLKEISLLLPNIKSQKKFSSFAKQADKSKAELQLSIKNIDKVMKSLLP